MILPIPSPKTPPPALTWTHLFPSNTAFACDGGPDWFRNLAAMRAGFGTRRARIIWDDRQAALNVSREHIGVAAINCRGISEGDWQAAGFSYARKFAVLPNLQHARWFIPLDSPAISSSAFSLYTPSRTSAKLKRFAARMAAYTRLPLWYRDQIWIAQRETPPLERTLGGLFPGQDVRLALSSGAPEGARNRKASALVLSRSGKMLAFAKIARSEISRRIMANEAEMLPRLANLPNPAPRILFYGDVDGADVLAQTPLDGRPAPLGITPMHRKFLESLQTSKRAPASESTMVASLPDRLGALSPQPAHLLGIFDALLPTLRRFIVPITLVHGDFAPWNLRVYQGRIGAFDWEYGEPSGLPLVDEIHYRLQSGWLLEDWTEARAEQELMSLFIQRPLGLEPQQARAIAVVYLLDALARLLGEGYEEHADVIAWHRRLLDRLAPASISGTREVALA